MTIIHTQRNEGAHKTIITPFKQALFDIKKTGFTEDQKGRSKVQSICEFIDKLLDDDLMMKPNNDFTFEQRTKNNASADQFI